MAKRSVFKHNGKKVCVTDFTFDGKVASGFVHGRKVSGEVFPYVYETRREWKTTADSNAKHFLVDRYATLYGDAPTLRGYRSEANDRKVKNSHIENLGNGICVGSADVEGERVEIMYTKGTCVNDAGEVMDAKPWLGDFRKDAVSKAKGRKRRVYAYTNDYKKVDDEFIRILSEMRFDGKPLHIAKGVVFIGDDKVNLEGMDKIDAVNAVKSLIAQYREAKSAYDARVEVELAWIVA